MRKINFENQQGWFITDQEKQQLDKIIKAVAKCGDDYNDIP